jgi:hypothetical protein
MKSGGLGLPSLNGLRIGSISLMLYGDLDFLEGCVYIDTNEGGKRKEKKERKSQPKTGCTYIYTCIYIYIGQCFSMALGLCLWGDIKRNGRIGSPQDLRH